MKKLVLSAIITITGTLSVNAQQNISKNALGLRFGSNDGIGYEVTYQRALSNNNRLEIDLGWRNDNKYDAVKLTGIYQWYWNIDNGFNWYAGVGGGISSWNYDYNEINSSGTTLFVAGQIGIEYNFDIPLQISLDFRPELYLNNNKYRNDFGPDIALGLRYKF